MKKILPLLFFYTFFVLSVFSQNSKTKIFEDPRFKTKYLEAQKFLVNENYDAALPLFLQLDTMCPKNANLNYNIGLCYINSVSKKIDAISYLEYAARNISSNNTGAFNDTTAPIYSQYYLAAAYHIDYQFDEAIGLFNQFKTYLTANNDKETLLEDVERRLEMCFTAKKIVTNPVFITIDNLGSVINSKYSDYAPCISADQNTLIMTSRREGSTGNKKELDGRYYEDIYISKRDENEVWSEPVRISTNINTEGHEASISLSPDGKELFIYRDDKGDGNIYSSKYLGGDWTKPVKLNQNVNSKSRETHACVTADGNILYFTSDREGSLGGLDIWKCEKLSNGDWGKAENLGPKVNSPLDEESPYILGDGATLYFSSQGHESMGGFDIFTSTLSENGFWSDPENLGYPINTTEDDIFYIPTQDEKQAYYSSAKEGGYGEQDIYLITIRKEKKQMLALRGIVTDASNQPLAGHLVFFDNDKKQITASFDCDPKSGEYFVSLRLDRNYIVTIKADGYKDVVETFEVKSTDEVTKMDKNYTLDKN